MKLLISFILLTGVLFSQELNLEKGMTAPDFTLEDQNGNKHTLSDYYNNSPVVIFFYPKAGTSGCTTQACGIRDSHTDFKELDVPVFGISTDSQEEIMKFVEDNSLNFPLLSDLNTEVSKDYGVLRPSGKSARYTFIIDKGGEIADVIEVKDVDAHAGEVLNRIKPLL
jgi:thioredoxin-dependent peroxiredoxin